MLLCSQETGKTELTVSVRPCIVNIVYGYGNKKHVFWLITARRSAYLFEADSDDIMSYWIRAIMQRSPTDDKEV